MSSLLVTSAITKPELGGPSTYLEGLENHLPGKISCIVTFTDTPQTHHPTSSIKISYKFLSPLVRQWNLFGQIFLHTNSQTSIFALDPLVTGFAALLVAFIKKRPLIVRFVGDIVWETATNSGLTQADLDTFYTDSISTKLKPLLYLQRLVLQHAKVIVTPSNYLKDFLHTNHHIPLSQIKVIANPIDFFPLTPAKKTPNTIIFVGRLVPWKNIDTIINAVVFAHQTTSINLSIVGTGPQEIYLKKIVKKLNAQKYIKFYGALSQTETQKKIAESDKLVLYSSYEGMSHTLIEAMLAETKIIASNIAPNKEVTGGFATFVKLNDTQALAEAMIDTKDFTTKAFKFAHKYSWNSHLKNLSPLLLI